ncbi:MAG: SDR family oxidoreductase [Actinobacteria bacterium]|nr:SDR family oxidoreductase [Actinomycetota bacterium]
MLEDLFSLDGRLAVVTGASGAIGREAARVFLALGATVVMTGRTPEHLDEARASLPADAPVTALLGDARDAGHVAEIAETAAAQGGADILVNSVGTNIRKPLLDATNEDMQFLWDVNMASVWAVTQALVPQMVEKGYGKIINMCSIGSFIGLELKTMYAITKGALAQHTRSAAVELAKYGIRVNGIAPGYVDTPMTHAWIHSEREEQFLSAIPLRRFAQVEDMGGAFAYLASRASDHMTGQLLVLDGGETISSA